MFVLFAYLTGKFSRKLFMQHDFAVDFRENEKFSSAIAGVPALDGAYPGVPAVACVSTLLSSKCNSWHPCCLRAQLTLCECMHVYARAHIESADHY